MPHGKNLKKISGQKKASEKIFETLQFEITLSKNFENVVKIIIRYLSLDGCQRVSSSKFAFPLRLWLKNITT